MLKDTIAMKYILTADIGTTALKTALYSQDGVFIAGCSREYAFVTPEPGQAELAAEVYTETFAAGIQSLLSDTGIDPSDIGVIGFSTQ
jgi:sugar (pentulose or hexulose) kinase